MDRVPWWVLIGALVVFIVLPFILFGIGGTGGSGTGQ